MTRAGGDHARQRVCQFGEGAIARLEGLIGDAVRRADDPQATELNHILREVEGLIGLLRSDQATLPETGAGPSMHDGQNMFARTVQAGRSCGAPTISEFEALTSREKEVVGQIVLGSSNKEIARTLGIAEATVKVHIKTLLRKLDLRNRTQAAACAIRGRWLASEQLPISITAVAGWALVG